jgi:hypothetical protein
VGGEDIADTRVGRSVVSRVVAGAPTSSDVQALVIGHLLRALC